MAENGGLKSAPPGRATWGRQPDSQLPEGAILNHTWRVGAQIARGGMGEVFRGENVHTGDPVAIKVLLPHLTSDPATQRLLVSEARKMNRVRHPAVVHYVTISQEPDLDVMYIVMDFIEGPSLGGLIGSELPNEAQLVSLARRLAEGLGAAHRAGVFHRDLSPDNILVPGGRLEDATVIDFGIARDTDPSHSTIVGDGFAGKIGFVAPEQFGEFDSRIGAWTDVYSLGLALLSFASGRQVDMGATLASAIEKRKSVPDVSGAPGRFQDLFAAMLAPNPAHRIQSMDAVLERLQHPTSALADEPTRLQRSPAAALLERAPPTAQEETHRLRARDRPTADANAPSPRRARAPAWAWAGGAVAAALVATGAWLTLSPAPKPAAAPPSLQASTAAPPVKATAPPVQSPTEPDPNAPILGQWAIEGLGCANPVSFAEAAGQLTRTFGGASVGVRASNDPSMAELGQTFRAEDGALYVLHAGALSMIPAGGGKPMTMSRCAG